eukprot:4303754-Pyramimonas_sp.AAC.1
MFAFQGWYSDKISTAVLPDLMPFLIELVSCGSKVKQVISIISRVRRAERGHVLTKVESASLYVSLYTMGFSNNSRILALWSAWMFGGT